MPESTATAAAHPCRDLRLLIAEDDRIFADYLVGVLNGLFACIDVLPSLAAVQGRLAADHVDAILLDLTLEDSRGLAPIHAIREAHPYLPIVVMTAGDLDAHKAIAAGACDFIHKNDVLPGGGRNAAQLIFDTVVLSIAHRATLRALAHAGVSAAAEAQLVVQRQIRARLASSRDQQTR